MLIEVTPVDDAVLPVGALREQLRMGTGFTDESVQDGLLIGCLRAALALIEARTGKAVLARAFQVRLPGWSDRFSQRLPVCPVISVDAVRIVDSAAEAQVVPPESYRLVQTAHRATLEALSSLPGVPEFGHFEIDLQAGYGAGWNAVPAGMRQAVLMVAAAFYEGRSTEGSDVLTPTVTALLAEFRATRLTLGRAG